MRKTVLILTVALLLASMTTFAQRQQLGTSNTYWELIINGGDTTLKISGSGAMPYDMYYLSTPWYAFNTTIKYLELGDSITELASGAFYGCGGLTSLTLPKELTIISYRAFANCDGLTSVTFPKGLTTIMSSAFENCIRLTSLVFPKGLTTIRDFAFSSCNNLTSITLPAGLTTIWNNAFEKCFMLAEINNLNPTPIFIDADAFLLVNRDFCTLNVQTNSVALYQQAPVWKDFSNIISGGAFVSAMPNSSFLGAISGDSNRFYTIGEDITLTATPVQGIDFIHWESNGNIISTQNPFTFTVTQDTALIACFKKESSIHITTAGTLENNLPNATEISKLILTGTIDARDIQYMRDSMTLLTELDLSGASIAAYNGTMGTNYGYDTTYPANEMPTYSFSRCTDIYGNCFPKLSLTSIILPDNLISIGVDAFLGCSNLTFVTFPEGLTAIGEYAFSTCGLTSVTLPSGITTLENGVFYKCSDLISVILPTGLDTIKNYVFSNCSMLIDINLSDNLTYIGACAFQNCSGLKSLTIGKGVTNIDVYAFQGCSSLETVYFNAINCTMLYGYNSSQVAFYGDTAIKTVIFGNGVTHISAYAFPRCSRLTTLLLPASVDSIGDWAFTYCTDLSEITNLNPTPINISYNVFGGVDKTACTLKVLSTSLPLYEQAAVWQDFLLEGVDYVVNVTANNAAYGTVSGGGFYPANADISLTATPNVGYKFDNWTSNGVVLSTSNSFTFAVTQDTNIVANFSNDVSIENMQGKSNEIILYPNPAQHTLYIESSEAVEQVSVYDISGRTVGAYSIHPNPNPSIDISGLANGIYLVKVKTAQGETVKKIVKQ